MKTVFARLMTAILAVLACSAVLSPAAHAGTLTSATFTANGTGYAVTDATNTRYDYRFTTASTNNLSNVKMTIPAGTRLTGQRYLAMNNTTGDYAGTADTPANSITGTLDIRVQVQMPTWKPAVEQSLVGKWDTSNGSKSYLFSLLPTGALQFAWSNNGTNAAIPTSSGPVGVDGQTSWVRVLYTPTGTSTETVAFYRSTDGTNWNLISSSNIGATSAIYDSGTALTVGNHDSGTHQTNYKLFYADVRNASTGTTTSPSTCTTSGVVQCFNPADYVSGTTLTSTSVTGEAWSIIRSSAALKADIAYDLTLAESAGVPGNGTVSYRMIDAAATYIFPTPTSVPASTAVLIAIAGFTNTSTASSYTSTITTYTNAGAVGDSATTSTLAFAPVNNSANVGIAVDPTFSFSVNAKTTACNGLGQSAGTTSLSTFAGLGRVTAAGPSTVAQDLVGGTNANTGYTIFIRSTGPLTAGTNTIAAVSGSNASPASFPGSGAAFGYTVSGLSRFNGALFAAADTSNQPISSIAAPGSLTTCIAYKVQVTAVTPAATYATTSIYTAVPNFQEKKAAVVARPCTALSPCAGP